MLPKKERFSSKDLSDKNFIKQGQKIYTAYGFFVIFNTPLSKKGIILSKKNFKTAVLRNKYKRLFYNTILELQKEIPNLKPKSFLFHPKKVFAKQELLKEMKEILFRAD